MSKTGIVSLQLYFNTEYFKILDNASDAMKPVLIISTKLVNGNTKADWVNAYRLLATQVETCKRLTQDNEILKVECCKLIKDLNKIRKGIIYTLMYKFDNKYNNAYQNSEVYYG